MITETECRKVFSIMKKTYKACIVHGDIAEGTAALAILSALGYVLQESPGLGVLPFENFLNTVKELEHDS